MIAPSFHALTIFRPRSSLFYISQWRKSTRSLAPSLPLRQTKARLSQRTRLHSRHRRLRLLISLISSAYSLNLRLNCDFRSEAMQLLISSLELSKSRLSALLPLPQPPYRVRQRRLQHCFILRGRSVERSGRTTRGCILTKILRGPSSTTARIRSSSIPNSLLDQLWSGRRRRAGCDYVATWLLLKGIY